MSAILLSAVEKRQLAKAREARKRAYAPYSKFRVGAVLRTKSGREFAGCNVENASYGLTICAERNAIAAAIAAGEREFVSIAVAGKPGVLTSPCGACRQVLAEFNVQMRVIYTAPGGPVVAALEELLPHSFGPFV